MRTRAASMLALSKALYLTPATSLGDAAAMLWCSPSGSGCFMLLQRCLQGPVSSAPADFSISAFSSARPGRRPCEGVDDAEDLVLDAPEFACSRREPRAFAPCVRGSCSSRRPSKNSATAASDHHQAFPGSCVEYAACSSSCREMVLTVCAVCCRTFSVAEAAQHLPVSRQVVPGAADTALGQP